MRINADFSQPAFVRAAEATWTPSPSSGVERLMLDRIGDEAARATSLVRYAPGSRFESHTHALGEEFLVLEGTFSDAQGDYGPGCYVRNPPGSAHAPWSRQGCTIFVKLRQFDGADRGRVIFNTARATGWREAAPGVERLALHRFGSESVALLRFPGAAGIDLERAGGLELLVVEGAAAAAGHELGRWDWLRLPPGGQVRLSGAPGTGIWLKSGHLPPRH